MSRAYDSAHVTLYLSEAILGYFSAPVSVQDYSCNLRCSVCVLRFVPACGIGNWLPSLGAEIQRQIAAQQASIIYRIAKNKATKPVLTRAVVSTNSCIPAELVRRTVSSAHESLRATITFYLRDIRSRYVPRAVSRIDSPVASARIARDVQARVSSNQRRMLYAEIRYQITACKLSQYGSISRATVLPYFGLNEGPVELSNCGSATRFLKSDYSIGFCFNQIILQSDFFSRIFFNRIFFLADFFSQSDFLHSDFVSIGFVSIVFVGNHNV